MKRQMFRSALLLASAVAVMSCGYASAQDTDKSPWMAEVAKAAADGRCEEAKIIALRNGSLDVAERVLKLCTPSKAAAPAAPPAQSTPKAATPPQRRAQPPVPPKIPELAPASTGAATAPPAPARPPAEAPAGSAGSIASNQVICADGSTPNLGTNPPSCTPRGGEVIASNFQRTTVAADWRRKPTGLEVQKYYPSSRLFARKRVGRARLLCMVNELGLLEDCIISGEYPVGEGFGDAALKLAPLFEMTPKTTNGSASRSFVTIPITFSMDGLPEPQSIQEKDMWYPAILKFYTKYAEGGYADAQVRLGYMYSVGEGMVAQDYTAAVRWYRKAADRGDATAQYSLGYTYANGQGVMQDYAAAISWFRKAADQGDASAQAYLGYLYANGLGVAQDYAAAVSWYRKAADQGNALAQGNLKALCAAQPTTKGCPAPIYANGQGVVQDAAAAPAYKYWRPLADRGDAAAQSTVGYLYANGLGVAQDYAAAVSWYRKAADQGNALAQGNLKALCAAQPTTKGCPYP